jgi:hypothetical protein
MKIDGDLDGGLIITAEMPRHLGPDQTQRMTLSAADSVVLARELAKMISRYDHDNDLAKVV